MSVLRVLLGDQLSPDLSALADLDPAHDVVLMMEVQAETTYVRHHKQKIVLVLSAMRHFAEALRATGVTVDYVRLDDPDNTGDLTAEVRRAVTRHAPDRLVITEPGEWRVQELIQTWEALTGVPVAVRDDTRFFASRARFADWARGRRGWRMEHFYREMRREHGLLMDGDQPAGGAWSTPRTARPFPRAPVPPRAAASPRTR
jgi:deoxyribodipyrimidine photolyase-related protein